MFLEWDSVNIELTKFRAGGNPINEIQSLKSIKLVNGAVLYSRLKYYCCDLCKAYDFKTNSVFS